MSLNRLGEPCTVRYAPETGDVTPFSRLRIQAGTASELALARNVLPRGSRSATALTMASAARNRGQPRRGSSASGKQPQKLNVMPTARQQGATEKSQSSAVGAPAERSAAAAATAINAKSAATTRRVIARPVPVRRRRGCPGPEGGWSGLRWLLILSGPCVSLGVRCRSHSLSRY